MSGFDFTVSRIEDGIIALLKSLYLKSPANPAGFLKTATAYGGDLDEKTLREFVNQLSPQFPLALVSYGDGEDQLMPGTSSALGAPRTFRHSCSFAVIGCSDDARGEEKQRAGVYRIIEGARAGLSGVLFASREVSGSQQIVVRVPNKKPEDGDMLLNLEPLTPSGVQYLARLPGLTAYAQHFDTYFKWTEPDRREAGTPVEEIVFDVTPLNNETNPGELPGVILK